MITLARQFIRPGLATGTSVGSYRGEQIMDFLDRARPGHGPSINQRGTTGEVCSRRHPDTPQISPAT